MEILKIKNLKSGYYTNFFKRNAVLSDVSFTFKRGIIYGLIGPNGAGKTTLFKTILGLIPRYEGEIQIFGSKQSRANNKWLEKVGYVPEKPLIPDQLTAYRFLFIYGGILFPRDRNPRAVIEEKLALVDLEDSIDQLIGTYSKGMKKRLMIANALLGDPDLLILDEPFEGLDPVQRVNVRNIFGTFRKSSKTIIISSHEIYELQAICEHMVLLENGKLMEFTSLENFDLHNKFTGNYIK